MYQRIKVWDLPTRLFHWTLAVSFTVAYLTAESEGWEELHELSGYTVLALLLFRVIWGLVGTRHARFSAFVRGPQAIVGYVRGLLARQPVHYTGHNPLGAVAILLMIGVGLAACASGWMLLEAFGGERLEDALEELHEGLANTWLIVILLHISGVTISSILHRENLPWAMLTGTKLGRPEESIVSNRPWVALALLAAIVAGWIWGDVDGGEGTQPNTAERSSPEDDHDDD